jgi:hypothetical protein
MRAVGFAISASPAGKRNANFRTEPKSQAANPQALERDGRSERVPVSFRPTNPKPNALNRRPEPGLFHGWNSKENIWLMTVWSSARPDRRSHPFLHRRRRSRLRPGLSGGHRTSSRCCRRRAAAGNRGPEGFGLDRPDAARRPPADDRRTGPNGLAESQRLLSASQDRGIGRPIQARDQRCYRSRIDSTEATEVAHSAAAVNRMLAPPGTPAFAQALRWLLAFLPDDRIGCSSRECRLDLTLRSRAPEVEQE